MAPNIYYLGSAGVVRFGGLRIAGLSGIYKHYDYEKSTYRKIYNLGVFNSLVVLDKLSGLVYISFLDIVLTKSHTQLCMYFPLSLDHFEFPPYDDRTIRSTFHVRSCDVFRLKQVSLFFVVVSIDCAWI